MQIDLTDEEKRILVEIINSVNIPGKAIEKVCIIKAKLMVLNQEPKIDG